VKDMKRRKSIKVLSTERRKVKMHRRTDSSDSTSMALENKIRQKQMEMKEKAEKSQLTLFGDKLGKIKIKVKTAKSVEEFERKINEMKRR